MFAAVLAASTPQAFAQGTTAITHAQMGLRQVPLLIHSATGVHHFTVEVAATPDEQEIGLMFRRSLAPNHGMIFPYDPPQEVAFWMKNTLISLDMVFVRPDGRIGRIATAKALDETPVPGGGTTAAVLEIRGGRAKEIGIKAGDRVEWKH